MPLTNGSGSCYFRHWPSRCQQKKQFFNTIFAAYYFLKVHLHNFSKIKGQKESQNSRNQGFFYYFCMMIEGSWVGSGSIPLTIGSGSATLLLINRAWCGEHGELWAGDQRVPVLHLHGQDGLAGPQACRLRAGRLRLQRRRENWGNNSALELLWEMNTFFPINSFWNQS